ncbi:MAG: hypothetical protein CL946_02290 [Ectothiorhodospiraceae bacterium]|nr:hypothetical protein [Ectothiorhodospiraceae bacterium]
MLEYGNHITVLLPAFNAEETLAIAIASLLDQTYPHFELLIIDDGSTDGTPEVVRRFDDARIRYLRKENGGLGNALNFGLKEAAHEWIARMDADDIAVPHRLERQVRYLDTHPEVDVLSSWYAMFDERGIRCIVQTAADHETIAGRLYLHSEIAHPGCMYRKADILDAGGYSQEIMEDYELWNRLRSSVRFANIPEVLMFIREQPDSITRKDIAKRNRTMRHIQQEYYGPDAQLSDEQHGWQEYFYGSKEKARAHWKQGKCVKLAKPRVLLAWMLTYLPEPVFREFVESRIRLRMEYLRRYTRPEMRILRELLRQFRMKAQEL